MYELDFEKCNEMMWLILKDCFAYFIYNFIYKSVVMIDFYTYIFNLYTYLINNKEMIILDS